MTTEIRPGERGDLDYILSSWMRTWERSPEMAWPGMIRDEYFRHAHLMLDELVARSSGAGALYVACEAHSPHIIQGYLCGEPVVWKGPPQVQVNYLHWVQVKKKYWGQGIATMLLDRYKRDFLIGDDDNILYTFGSSAAKREMFQPFMRRHNFTAWPWFKYTSQEPGWESGR
jgi:GNAT superfamily N-acetyltransferase